MDYIFIASLMLWGMYLLNTFIVSYDIVCQWSVHLFSRVAKINPATPILNAISKTRFVVPKFHLPAHIPSCQTRFAFMFTQGAGLGDGEAPERGWADSNPLGPSTREMGPGSRRDTLDYHWGDYNWTKIIELGMSFRTRACRTHLLKRITGNFLFKKLETAVLGVAERIHYHRDLEKTLGPGKLQAYMEEVTAWESNPNDVPNPFDMTISTPSQCAVRKALSVRRPKGSLGRGVVNGGSFEEIYG